VYNYYQPEEPDDSGGQKMEFRLIYQGPLPPEKCSDKKSASGGAVGRAKDKQLLRKKFHKQLRELWRSHPDLVKQSESYFLAVDTSHNLLVDPGPAVRQINPVLKDYPGAKTWLNHKADSHVRCNGNRFVPLISSSGGFTCALDILFLRRDDPGNLIDNRGDIDNRIKVLFDGLRMPRDVKELGGYVIDPEEDPFFCLLEDDRLITKVSVTTDRLVIPQSPEEGISDVLLVIHVTMVNPSAVFAGGRLA
jgi:hypothetical protein